MPLAQRIVDRPQRRGWIRRLSNRATNHHIVYPSFLSLLRSHNSPLIASVAALRTNPRGHQLKRLPQLMLKAHRLRAEHTTPSRPQRWVSAASFAA